ncbi:hypothetical protein DYB37_010308 [Aphanomyces astaci]|uniref:COX assembly mitochondrial protein n=1 Tax=Aphanomyces astaci TaxID=112090 RepID=A0A397ES14_APHAT|nr:hypothetical protein DYB31_014801 [Aphanomyces astaci]RHZ12440.1 hypothetical protein DYB37_010308 [Aphanomyces astaci]RHZ42026.1 hypothetical protein DYB26_015841 [Aphanomyces astaci]
MSEVVPRERMYRSVDSIIGVWTGEYPYRLHVDCMMLTTCCWAARSFAQRLMVVFKCREQNHALNECLHEYTSKEALEALKAAKVSDIPVVIKEVPRKKYFEQ